MSPITAEKQWNFVSSRLCFSYLPLWHEFYSVFVQLLNSLKKNKTKPHSDCLLLSREIFIHIHCNLVKFEVKFMSCFVCVCVWKGC